MPGWYILKLLVTVIMIFVTQYSVSFLQYSKLSSMELAVAVIALCVFVLWDTFIAKFSH